MSKGLKRACGALLFALGLYSLLGFLVLPGIALRIANQQLSQLSQVPARLERMELNPFSLELSLWGLHLGAADQEQVAFERLYANLQADSLWSGAVHLEAVELAKPHAELLFAKDGQLNLTQLFKVPPSEPSPPPSEPLALRIDRIQLSGGSLHFRDLRPSEPIEFSYDTLDFELKRLSTLPEDNAEMTLVASGPAGSRLDWSGSLGLVPIRSEGRLKISDSRMKLFWPYVRDAVPLVLENGVVNLATDYRLDLSKGTELKLLNGTLELSTFAIKAPDNRPLVRLAQLEISDISLDLVKQQVVLGKIRSQGLETWAAREADGQLDWQKLFAGDPATAPATPPPATPAAAPDKAPTASAAKGAPRPWQVLLTDTQLRDYRVHLADRLPTPEVALELGPLNLDLKDFDSLGQSPFHLTLDSGVGKQGRLKVSGEVQLTPLSTTLQVATQALDLRLAQAYLSPFVRLELRSGLLGADLAVALKGDTPPALSLSGRAELDQLHLLDTLKERDLLKWQKLTLEGLDYRHGDSLSINSLALAQPYARFIINEDLTTNLSDLLVPQPPAAATEPTPEGRPLGIRIGEIKIADGSANFADFSLTPDFATAIQQLNGRIGTLDSRKTGAASVEIQGKVDRYAPVSIQGKVNPFDPLDSLDIATRFKNVELTTLTPYSGKFAGFRIRKGRLNLDLVYRIEKGQLSAENKVVLENLELGERVDSPSAVDLPIRLAVALLKDTEGRISIELPVSGDLNNPQFSVMPIVWQTLRNLVLRAAQAPFKFIGGLVSGAGEVDLSTVQFAPGSDVLDGPAQAALDLLAKALQERPALRLEVEGISAQSSDGPLLAEQRLQREYQNNLYKILQRRGDTVPAEASLLEVPEDEKASLLEAIYRARLKQQPPAEWAQLPDEERYARQRQTVIDSWGQSTLLLRKLGQARASSIKAYLVERGGLQDQRVYLLDTSVGQAQADGRVATQLHLGSE
ncbi:MAG: DUF748 domain-containing protein [Pseudomonas sp.]|uniref:DUF748 domain-containing protein n=1 Tax=Pseudomonas sp. TaxID=306 RepID=UPI003397974F